MRYVDPDGRYSLEQFKADITPAINLDFGYDYTQLAAQAWENGEYLKASLYEIDATCEMLYDGLLAYGGAKTLDSVVKATLMLSGTLASLSPSSTVVLGKYNTGVCGGYTKMADTIGAKCFQLPSKLYNVLEKIKVGDSNLGKIINEKWLDGVIKSGVRILLNSNPNTISPDDTSAYALEISKLKEAGFNFVKTMVQGVECWEAIQ